MGVAVLPSTTSESQDTHARYTPLDWLGEPVWIFDIDRRRVHWANGPAIRLWRAESLAELCARDMGVDMSPSVAARLQQYQTDFEAHGARFSEQWTLYPAGHPVSLNVSFSGHRLPDGRMAMLCEARSAHLESPESLRSVEALLHTAVMITLYDGEGRPLYRNPAARNSVRSLDERLAERLWNAQEAEPLLASVARGGHATATACVHTSEGQRWHEISLRQCRDAATGVDALLVSEVDVTAIKQSEAQASYLAVHDSLTGLPNRAHVRERFSDAVGCLQAQGLEAALMIIDLDRFKDVNDTLGHAAGDELLVQVAQRLASSVRGGDTVARFGGDEFLVLVAAHEIRAEVGRIHARMRHTVSQPLRLGATEVRMTATIGVSLFPKDGTDFETLLRHADLAMYAAKQGGRDAMYFYDATMGESVRARTELEHDLRRALATGEFEVHYQPRVSVATNRIVGAEALVRWRHPQRGLVPPAEFIPVCESTGQIRELGRFVFAQAARQQARWAERGHDLSVSVNLSPRELADPRLVADMAEALSQAGGLSSRMELEITESLLIGTDARLLSTLQQLERLGLSIALDDFGTGYSNLAYLQRFPIHALKIDRSFIQGIESDRPLAELIVALCRLMKLSAVAEGVETAEQLAWVRSQGIDQYQGFLFARPLTAGSFDALLGLSATT